MSHFWFLLGALGFATICALILSERWQGLAAGKVDLAAAIAALSGIAHCVAASLDGQNFGLSWLFGAVGFVLAIGWRALADHLRVLQGEQQSAKRPIARSQLTQRSIAATSTALAFVSALAFYMEGLGAY